MRVPVACKRVLGTCWRVFGARSRSRPRGVVLLYHSIDAGARSGLAVSPASFEAQMHYLKEHARVMSLKAMLSDGWRNDGAPLTCAITFDDGYASVYKVAYPILLRCGFPATLYATTGAIDNPRDGSGEVYAGLSRDERMLTWSEISEMRRSGLAVGSHLHRHRRLPELQPESAMKELTVSRETLEDRLGEQCRDFAFPYGQFTQQTIEWVKACGYHTAAGVCPAPLQARVDRYNIPRMTIRREYTTDDFAAMLRGDWDYRVLVLRLAWIARA
jgi:peptidoglycan/xylan/chitin deacetylase (PgdA/CDA1 family)